MNNAPYTPSHVANFILDKAAVEGIGISQVALQKHVYIAYGWVLAILERELFDEKFQAWKRGPVCPSLYHEFKHFGGDDILERSCVLSGVNDLVYPKIPKEEEEVLNVLTLVWNIYKHFDPWQLVAKTHEEGTPWHAVYKPEQRYISIPTEKIKAHFERKIRDYLENVPQKP